MKEYTSTVNSIYEYRTPYELLIAKRYPEASIAIYDVHSLLTDIYYNPTAFGLTAPAIVDHPYYLCDTSGANCVSSSISADHYMWYDELHPSQQTDEAIAKEFVNVVKGDSKYATYWKQ